jgi:UDP-2,4-diacetamido-2,4,6-trideoxy-beta-L-altropyranose hydrolase
VADGYRFGANWQELVKDAGFRLLIVDDYKHAEHYCADLILNQNLHAQAGLYAQRQPHTRLLLGTGFAQLRREFLEWRTWRREIPPVARKVLVTLGGADPDNVTDKVIQALASLRDVEAVVIVGGSNPNLDSLQFAIRNPQSAIRLVVDVANMPELMAWADVGVSAGGFTSWELAFMGLPSIVIVIAANQTDVAGPLDREGVTVNLGEHAQVSVKQIAAVLQSVLADSARRTLMSRRGRALVDGLGVDKVVTRMRAALLTLRRVSEADCRLIWEWDNDSEVRAVSFSSDPIPWESHVRWYEAKWRDPNCFFYIATNSSGNPFGQIRFDIIEYGGMVSVSVAHAMRGKGYGSALITLGVEKFFAESSANVVHAYIRTDNQTSVRAFEKAGFSDGGTVNICEQQSRHFVLEREPV